MEKVLTAMLLRLCVCVYLTANALWSLSWYKVLVGQMFYKKEYTL